MKRHDGRLPQWLLAVLAVLAVALYTLLRPGDLDWMGVVAFAALAGIVFVTIRHLDDFSRS